MPQPSAYSSLRCGELREGEVGGEVHQLPAMICQLEPSDFRSAHLPAVAARIAVPAAPPTRGTTLEASDTTVCAWIVRIVSSRPGTAAADSRVSVIVPARFAMNALSADVIVSVMFRPVLGAGVAT